MVGINYMMFGPANKSKWKRPRRSRPLTKWEDAIQKYKSFVIVDDLLATGGTARCVGELLMDAGKQVEGLSVVVELSALKISRLGG